MFFTKVDDHHYSITLKANFVIGFRVLSVLLHNLQGDVMVRLTIALRVPVH
jgi:hypothetical protein